LRPIVIATMFVCSLAAFSQTINLNQLSLTSLGLRIMHDDAEIGTATGFVFKKGDKYYLVTNRHVVMGCGEDRNPANVGAWICANKLAIFHNQRGHLGSWVWITEELFGTDKKPRWLEHPTLAGGADLVAVPLAKTENVQFYPLDIELGKADVVLSPGDAISIVGFPMGLTQGAGLPVWKTGTVASDMDINYQGKPVFLADTTSRGGMSGSPVYAIRSGAYNSSKGTMLQVGGSVTKFLGVYSAQAQAIEIGYVWKAEVVSALYESLP
jgi:trypsin-like peptidase